jgi:hypothetical protein
MKVKGLLPGNKFVSAMEIEGEIVGLSGAYGVHSHGHEGRESLKKYGWGDVIPHLRVRFRLPQEEAPRLRERGLPIHSDWDDEASCLVLASYADLPASELTVVGLPSDDDMEAIRELGAKGYQLKNSDAMIRREERQKQDAELARIGSELADIKQRIARR